MRHDLNTRTRMSLEVVSTVHSQIESKQILQNKALIVAININEKNKKCNGKIWNKLSIN